MRSRVALLIVLAAIIVVALGCAENITPKTAKTHPYPLCEKPKSQRAIPLRGDIEGQGRA